MPNADESMVERVTAAIKRALQEHGETEYVGETPRSQNRTQLSGDFDLHKIAQAAIEAMREPTQDMILEGESAASVYLGKPQNDEGVPYLWREMVGAALRRV